MKTLLNRTAAMLISGISLTAALTGTSQAQVYRYETTIGVPGLAGADNSHFNAPAIGAVDSVNNHLFVADILNQRVQVYDASTLAYVGTIGTVGVAGADNAHFNQPDSVAVDAQNGHILITDLNNFRIQVFDARTFAYVATLGVTGVSGSDNAHFNDAGSVAVNPNAGQLYVTDQNNHRVQIFNARTFAYIATLGQTGTSGGDHNHFNLPSDAQYNSATNQIMVADTGNSRLQIFDAGSLVPTLAIGGLGTGGTPTDNTHFGSPINVTFDPSNQLVLVVDSTNERVQVFNGMTYAYVGTLGVTGAVGGDNGHFSNPAGVIADSSHSRIFVGDIFNERVQVFSDTPSPLHSSVLPGARSVQLGATPTVFANILNSGSMALSNCQISLPSSAPAGLSLTYQPTDPATNHPVGSPNTPVSIPAAPPGGASIQTFVLTFDSTNPLDDAGQPLVYSCDGVAPAAVFPAVNTVDLIFSSTPVPDVIALAATSMADGIVRIPETDAGAFAVASINIGVTDTITASLDTGAAALPITATICQTGPSGACLAPPAAAVTLAYANGATPTFSIFVTASAAVPLDPADSRLFVRFLDGSGVSHGATSVAVGTD
jgi:hypothetical protein